MCEELWQRLGHTASLAYTAWPSYDEALTQDETVEIAVQVRGKVRARIVVPRDADEQQIVAAALAQANVARELSGKAPRRSIVVKGRLVNLIPSDSPIILRLNSNRRHYNPAGAGKTLAGGLLCRYNFLQGVVVSACRKGSRREACSASAPSVAC